MQTLLFFSLTSESFIMRNETYMKRRREDCKKCGKKRQCFYFLNFKVPCKTKYNTETFFLMSYKITSMT